MPENVSIERRQLLEIFGAEIVLSPGEEGSNGAIRVAEKLVAEDPSQVMLFQYGNPANPTRTTHGTGPEILRDCPEVDVFVAGLGTSGTLMGVGRYLKEHKPAVQSSRSSRRRASSCRACAPSTTASSRRSSTPTSSTGSSSCARASRSSGPGACSTTAAIFAGISSGAVVAGAAKMAATMDEGTIVTLLPDGGWKYLSSGAWTDDLDVVEERATRINFW